MKYLTPQAYRLSDCGLPFVVGMPDETIARYIARAEAAVDMYIGFDSRLGGFEPHSGIWHQEGWNPQSRRVRIPAFPVPVRNIQSFRIHISNSSPGGLPFVATLLPGDCVINEFEGYVEVIPLQSILYSLTPVLAQFGLRPPIVMLDYESGYYFTARGETFFDSGDHQTYRAQHQFWALTYTQTLASQPVTLPPIPPVIAVNGVVVAASEYTINATEGQITFTTPQATGAAITGDYAYTIPDPVHEATIEQTTYQLVQRQHAEIGIMGLNEIKSGTQQVRKTQRRSSSKALDEPSLAPLAMQLLLPFRQIALG